MDARALVVEHFLRRVKVNAEGGMEEGGGDGIIAGADGVHGVDVEMKWCNKTALGICRALPLMSGCKGFTITMKMCSGAAADGYGPPPHRMCEATTTTSALCAALINPPCLVRAREVFMKFVKMLTEPNKKRPLPCRLPPTRVSQSRKRRGLHQRNPICNDKKQARSLPE